MCQDATKVGLREREELVSRLSFGVQRRRGLTTDKQHTVGDCERLRRDLRIEPAGIAWTIRCSPHYDGFPLRTTLVMELE
jgi:hypothetical protein